jgi:hypothetical protein
MPQRHDPDSYRDSKKHKVFIMNVLRFVMLGDLVPLPCRQAGWWHEKNFSELAQKSKIKDQDFFSLPSFRIVCVSIPVF